MNVFGEPIEGVRLLGSGTYTSSFVVGSQTVEAPSWTRMDVGVRYHFESSGRPVVLGLNVENVFDKAYWMSASLYRGAPRTFLFSATVSL